MEGLGSPSQAAWPLGWGGSVVRGNAVCMKPCLITTFLPDPIRNSSALLKDTAHNMEAARTAQQIPFPSKSAWHLGLASAG